MSRFPYVAIPSHLGIRWSPCFLNMPYQWRSELPDATFTRQKMINERFLDSRKTFLMKKGNGRHGRMARVACPQGIEGLGMAGPGETLGSPWPTLAIRPCQSWSPDEYITSLLLCASQKTRRSYESCYCEAKWIVFRGQLIRGHNDTPFGRPTPGRPIICPRVSCPQGVFDGLSYYQLVIFFFNIVSLIREFTLGPPYSIICE
jgi:hypothetical protein